MTFFSAHLRASTVRRIVSRKRPPRAGLFALLFNLVWFSGLGCFELEAQATDTASRVAAATLPLVEQLRADATVVVKTDQGTIAVLKKGSNGMVCTNETTRDTFSVYCFNESFFTLLNRADELSKQLGSPDNGKVVGDAMDKEIKAGKLTLPERTTVGFAMRGPISGYNPTNNTVNGEIKRWQMIQVPYATGKALALPEQPATGLPWVMAPGTWMAHIMIEH